MYTGPERRRHKVYVTNNTEYHLRDLQVVAVRGIGTGTWQQNHTAVGRSLVGGAYVGSRGEMQIRIGAAQVGDKLILSGDIMTSPVQQLRRPTRDTVEMYPIAS